jgi:cellobiose phosphorylase
MLLLEWILGARRHYDGLLVDPCLTKEIKHAEVKRTFRGTVFNIELDNSAGNCLGAQEIYLDGELIDGNIISLIDGKEHSVRVII